MSIFLQLAFLFFVGSVSGWVLELLFRRFFSRANPERKWINPAVSDRLFGKTADHWEPPGE